MSRARPRVNARSLAQPDVLELVTQLLYQSIDLHLEGKVTRIAVELASDHFSIYDDGPGLSPRALGRSLLCAHATDLARSAGTRPPCFATALIAGMARRVEIHSVRHGLERRWLFESREPVVLAEPLGPSAHQGTCLRVWPDPALFPDPCADRHTLAELLRNLHRLRPSLQLSLDGQRFEEHAGAHTWVSEQCALLPSPPRVHVLEGRMGTTQVELAWAEVPPFGSARCLSYVNLQASEGGAHVEGLMEVLSEAYETTPAMARERTLALASVVALNPNLCGSTRSRLDDAALQRWIAQRVRAQLAAPEPCA